MVSPQSSRTLQKMIEAAATNRHGCTWSHILQYLKANAVVDSSAAREFGFETPLATYYVASPLLAQELAFQNYDVLKVALASSAPKRILAAICQLAPQAVRTQDGNGRLPLHIICRYPPNDAVHVALQILIPAYPAGLLHQDEKGRTPFHYIFQYHPTKRTAETVSLFLQKHWWPTSTTTNNNPCLVPDSIYGALPLHYAVAGRASTSVIQAVVAAAPATKHAVDATYGRTPLHWYVSRFPNTTATGEPPASMDEDDDIPSVATVHHLVSSRTVRTLDAAAQRSCLHDACAAAACGVTADWGGVIATLLDVHVGLLVAQDAQGQTPLMVLLDTAAQQQQHAWESEATVLQPFSVPWLHLFFKNPKCWQLQDATGRLPLHAAATCGLMDRLDDVVQQHPPALLHMNEHLQVPLHSALCSPAAAALQTTAALRTLLLSTTTSSGVDGRLALKMEDGEGWTPLQYACTHAASADCIELLVQAYPQAACVRTPAGDLPLQCCCSVWLWTTTTTARDDGDNRVRRQRQTQSTSEQENNDDDDVVRMIQCLTRPLLVASSSSSVPCLLGVADSRYGMTPLHILVLFRAASYEFLLQVLQHYPLAAAQYTTAPFRADSPSRCSPLDLHELYGQRDDDNNNNNDFQAIRELLYSFHPTAASHRHRQELLEQCVQIIVADVAGSGSVHYLNQNQQSPTSAAQALCISHTVSRMERVYKKRLPRAERRRLEQRTTTTAAAAPHISSYSSSGGVRSSSLYDDDDTGLDDYTMTGSSSLDESDDDDDDEDGGYTTQYTTGGDDEDDDDASCYSSSSGSSGYTEDRSRSLYSDNHTTTFEEDLMSNQASYETAPAARAHAEEKKDDDNNNNKMSPPPSPRSRKTLPQKKFVRPSFMSEVSIRLWTFFVLYRDPNNPSDNYVQQLSEIIEAIDYPSTELLVTHPVPPYAQDYLVGPPSNKKSVDGLSYGDLASPKCRELIHKTCFFLGRYEFHESNSSGLIHNGWDDTSIMLEWMEWVFTTEEHPVAATPGMAEQSIWATGEVPPDKSLTFRKRERPVWILFTKNRAEYDTEIAVRQQLRIPVETTTTTTTAEGGGNNNAIYKKNEDNDTCICPLLNHYSSLASDRKDDRLYSAHVRDARFRSVVVGRSEVQLSDYPYAMVFEKPRQGTVADYVRRSGIPSTLDQRQIALDVATALQHLHKKGLFNGDISLRNITMCDADGGSFSVLRTSMLMDGTRSFVGGFDENGFPQFCVDNLPPEMFASLSPAELKHYTSYWNTIREEYNVKVDERIVRPLINFETGEAQVVRCHFIPQTNKQEIDLTPPYELMRPSRGNDFWAFGQLLYTIITGRHWRNNNETMGYIEDIGANFRHATSCVYEYVNDPLAKDLLLRCLGSPDVREKLSIEAVLKHPYFARQQERSDTAKKIIEQRAHETVQHSRRLLRKMNDIHGKKLKENSTVKVQCWDIGLLERFCFSPTQIFLKSMSSSLKSDLLCPCSLILLPHDINDCETTPKSLAVVEQIGLRLLEISKACFFTSVMQQATTGMRPSSNHAWSTEESMRVLDFSAEEFTDMQASLGEFAAIHVELFRDSPASIAAMVAEKRVRDLLKCFEDRPIYAYHVDELTNELLSDSPITVTGAWREKILRCCLPSMMLTSLYARGWAKSVSGLAQLMFPSGYRDVPASWSAVCGGLNHELDDGAFLNELEVLQNALEKVFEGTESNILSTIGDFWDMFDPDQNRFAGLKRVETNNAVLWTKHVEIINYNRVSMSAALKDYRKLAKLQN